MRAFPIFIILLLFLATGCEKPAPRPDTLLSVADSLIDCKAYDQALLLLKNNEGDIAPTKQQNLMEEFYLKESRIYQLCGLYEEANRYANRVLHTQGINDSLLYRTYIQLHTNYLYMGEKWKDSSKSYLQKVLKYNRKETELTASIFYFHTANFKKALSFINQYLTRSLTAGEQKAALIHKGQIFWKYGISDSAFHYTLQAQQIHSDDINLNAAAYYTLYNLSKQQGKETEALENLEHFTTLFDTLTSNFSTSINDLQAANGKYQLRIQNLEHRRNTYAIIISGLLLIIACLVTAFIIIRRKQFKIKKLRQTLAESRKQIAELQENEEESSLSIEQELTQLFESNKRLSIQLYQMTPTFHKLSKIEKSIKANRIVTPLTPDELREMDICFQELLPDIVTQLRQIKGIRIESIRFCILSYLGYTPKVCASITNADVLAINQRKYRLKSKLPNRLFIRLFGN